MSSCSHGQSKSSKIKIIRDDEKGIPYVYSIVVKDIRTKESIPGAKVFTYQTNHVGDYESSRPEDARIAGTLWTDKNGSGEVTTIFPRGYNDSDEGEHIHFRVSAQGYQPAQPTLMFMEFYNDRYDFDNPETRRAYLAEADLESSKRTGKVILYLMPKE